MLCPELVHYLLPQRMPFHSAGAVCGGLVLPSREPNLPILTSPDLRCVKCHGGNNRASRNQNIPSKRPPPSKMLLKAKDAVREQLSSLSLSVLLDADDVDPDKLSPGQAIGLVASAQANFMTVVVDRASDGDLASDSDSDAKAGVELLCVVRAVLKKIKKRVLVGDKVLVGSVDWVAKRGMIENVFSRETEIADPPIANANHLLVLFSLQQPEAEPFTLTRFLVEAESTGLPFTIVMNKTDLVSQQAVSLWKTRLHSWGYQPLFCSVDKKLGVVDLDNVLKGKTTVVVGPSGVGKSSLINAIRSNHHGTDAGHIDRHSEHSEEEDNFDFLPVGSVSSRSGRGKHTTRHVSLLPLSEEGYVADTPGFSYPNLMKASKETLAYMFPEVRNIFDACEPERCSFSDCLHIGEPGCMVKGDWERYPYYLQLLNEIKVREEVHLRTLGTKRESNVRHKMGVHGVRQSEPRLELKKHRRVSRKKTNQCLLDDYDNDWEES